MSTDLPGVPAGYSTVTPWIISRDTARLLDFMRDAFGAEEIDRVYVGDGVIGHAETRIGDSVVMAFDARPEWPATLAFLRLCVEDGDAVHKRALDAGATSVTEMTEMFWGDPLGNVWWIQSRVAELEPAEIERRASEPQFIEAMNYVMSAEIVLPTREG